MTIITNTATCGLCQLPIVGHDGYAFPPFMANHKDNLYRFSDAVFHRSCLDEDSSGALAIQLIEAVLEAGRPASRLCAVCGARIDNPDDYFGTGLLTSEMESPLAAFNFVHLHRSHWGDWDLRNSLAEKLASAVSTGKWEGPKIVFDQEKQPSWQLNSG